MSSVIDQRFAKGDRMRELILQQAVYLVGVGGIENLSAAKLASACGISKSNVFHHFKNTDAILLAVSDQVIGMAMAAIGAPCESLEAYLDQLLTGMLEMSEEAQGIYKSFFAFYCRSLFHDNLRQRLLTATADLQGALARQLFIYALRSVHVVVVPEEIDQAPEYLKPKLRAMSVASKTCALMLFSFMDGMALQLLLGTQGDDGAPLGKQVNERVAEALKQQRHLVKHMLMHALQ